MWKFTETYPTHNFEAQWVHSFSPTLINEVRTGFNLENVAPLRTHTNSSFTIESLRIMGMKSMGQMDAP